VCSHPHICVFSPTHWCVLTHTIVCSNPHIGMFSLNRYHPYRQCRAQVSSEEATDANPAPCKIKSGRRYAARYCSNNVRLPRMLLGWGNATQQGTAQTTCAYRGYKLAGGHAHAARYSSNNVHLPRMLIGWGGRGQQGRGGVLAGHGLKCSCQRHGYQTRSNAERPCASGASR